MTASPESKCQETPASSHCVYFYEDGDLLRDEVARYISAALNRGHTGIVIARVSFRRRLALELNKHRRDQPVSNQYGTLIALDAQETLDKFMVAGWPHQGKFDRVVGDLVERCISGGEEVAAYGEMVGLLCEQGNFDAAVHLEKLWNDLLGKRRFSLICGYSAGLFTSPAGRASYKHLCDAHHKVFQV
jgi:hypothetical protein